MRRVKTSSYRAPRRRDLFCSQIGLARPFPHYRSPRLVVLPPLDPLVVAEFGLEGGAEFSNLRSGSIHPAPNPAVKARASFCVYWVQQGHMQ